MTQYASVTEFIQRYGRAEALALTRLDNPNATTVDNALLNKRLIDASERVRSYIGVDLTSPFPTVVVDVTCTIARALLDRNRRREDVQADFDDAIAWCRDVAKGLVKIPGVEPAQVLPHRGAAVVSTVDGGRWYERYRQPSGY